MIKRTFYNLPSAKREKIIEVTRKEFSKGNKKKITINSVIEKAGISRGSFYQYFDDKLDLVELVMDDMIEKMSDFIQDELLLNGGDIFEVPVRIFDLMTSERSDLNGLIALPSPSDANQNQDLISDYMQYRYREFDYISKFKEKMDLSQFADDSRENVECVVCMMFDALKTAMFNINKNMKKIESEREILIRKIRIIKNGVIKH